jgi:hypothetical protein
MICLSVVNLGEHYAQPGLHHPMAPGSRTKGPAAARDLGEP